MIVIVVYVAFVVFVVLVVFPTFVETFVFVVSVASVVFAVVVVFYEPCGLTPPTRARRQRRLDEIQTKTKIQN